MSENLIWHHMTLTNTSDYPIPASIKDRRNAPIINKPDDYEMSITRFQLPNTLPLFYPVIPDPAFPTRSNMSITLQYSGVNFRQYLNADVAEVKDGCFNIGVWLDHLNTASGIAFGLLKAAYPAASGTVCPLFYLSATSGLISMYVQDLYLESNVNRIRIGFNQDLEQIMNLQMISVAFGAAGGFDGEVAVRGDALSVPAVGSRNGYPVGIAAVAGNVIQVSQEFESKALWNFIKSIIFKTDMIPVAAETFPSTFTSYQNTSVNSSYSLVLTDFDLDKTNIDRNAIRYLPTAQYRFQTLNSSSPMMVADITAYSVDYLGVTRPYMLNKNGCMDYKILFQRKQKI